MNTTDTTTTDTTTTSDKAAARAELAEAFRSEKIARAERAPYVAACIEAGQRLAAFAWTQRRCHEDAETIARMLASIYNGGDARRVRLDEIRWLEWTHQRDLVAVILGTGQDGTPDTHIRKAFLAAGGQPAVDWMVSFCDYSEPEHPAVTAARVRRVLTEESRAWRAAHRAGGDYLDTAAKSAIEAKIAAAIKG